MSEEKLTDFNHGNCKIFLGDIKIFPQSQKTDSDEYDEYDDSEMNEPLDGDEDDFILMNTELFEKHKDDSEDNVLDVEVDQELLELARNIFNMEEQ